MSRFDRQSQLNQLESVIENKKREIQAKIEAQKKKETEDALLKIQKATDVTARRPLWKRQNEGPNKAASEVAPPPVHFSNVFSNDGSFLDQFKKLSKSGLKPDKVDVETLAKAREAEEKEKERRKAVNEEKTQRQIERNMREREREIRKMERDKERDFSHDRDRHGDRRRRRSGSNPRERSPKRAPLDANIKLELPPPGVVQLVPQVQLLTSMMISPMPQLLLNPAPAPFTTNQIQMQAAGLSAPTPGNLTSPPRPPNLFNCPPFKNFSSLPPMVNLPSVPPPHALAAIPPPLPIPPHSIPPPSPIQVDLIPPPPSPPQIPGLGDIPQPPSKKRKKRPAAVLSCAPPPDFYADIPLPPTSLPEQVPPALWRARDAPPASLESGARHLAKMVATSGDRAEEILKVANMDDPALRFLFESNSAKYKEFRRCVEAYRAGLVDESDESKPASDDDDEDEVTAKQGVKDYDPEDSDDSGSDSKKNIKADPEEKYDPADCGSDSDSEPETKPKQEFDWSRYSQVKEESNPFGGFKREQLPFMKKEEIKDEPMESGYSFETRPSFGGVKSETSTNSAISFVKSEPGSELDAKRQRKSRWGEKAVETPVVTVIPTAMGLPPPPVAPAGPSIQLPPAVAPTTAVGPTIMLSQVTRKDPGLLAYAHQTFGSINLSEEDWKRAEDHYKINLLYQNMMKKREQLDKLAQAGKFKYEYDSDEDTEGGTWEHKLRNQEMTATQLWADELTRQAEGKHHIGDFLPPDELERFMEKYNAAKGGREPDLSDYKEFKLQEDNVGYQLLQKMGWSEGQGLGQEGQGIIDPVNKASTRMENQGLGLERPDGVDAGDDEFSAYRKRMMLAYRFRPNPLNNPRRPYY